MIIQRLHSKSYSALVLKGTAGEAFRPDFAQRHDADASTDFVVQSGLCRSGLILHRPLDVAHPTPANMLRLRHTRLIHAKRTLDTHPQDLRDTDGRTYSQPLLKLHTVGHATLAVQESTRPAYVRLCDQARICQD
jgi:hypothetical protein